jgi:hypothetical protein
MINCSIIFEMGKNNDLVVNDSVIIVLRILSDVNKPTV